LDCSPLKTEHRDDINVVSNVAERANTATTTHSVAVWIMPATAPFVPAEKSVVRYTAQE